MSAAIRQSVVMLHIGKAISYLFNISLASSDYIESLERVASLEESPSSELYLSLLDNNLTCYELRMLIFQQYPHILFLWSFGVLEDVQVYAFDLWHFERNAFPQAYFVTLVQEDRHLATVAHREDDIFVYPL